MNKLILVLSLFILSGCVSSSKAIYNIEMELVNGDLITRQYVLDDSITLFIKRRNNSSFLVYNKKGVNCYPFLLRKKVVKFNIK